MNQWIPESMCRRIDDAVNPRTNESLNQWMKLQKWNEIKWNERMTELVGRWVNESMNQWISQLVRQWNNETMNEPTRISESMNQWINESVNQWISEWTNERIAGWVDGRKEGWMDRWVSHLILCWATSSLSDLFAEAPLPSATSSLSSHLFGLPASQLPL